MFPTNSYPFTSTPTLHVVYRGPNPAPDMNQNSVTLYFNSDSAPNLNNIISVLSAYTHEISELHNAFRDELIYALVFIKQKLSDIAHFTNEEQQQVHQFAINAVIERCRKQEIQGATGGQYQQIFITLFPQLVEAVRRFLEQRIRVVIRTNPDNQHYLFVDQTSSGIYLFYSIVTRQPTQPVCLMFLMLNQPPDSSVKIDLSYPSWGSEQPCNSADVPSRHRMQTRSKSLQQAAPAQSVPHSSQQPFIQNRRQTPLQPLSHQYPPTKLHFIYSHIESPTNRSGDQLPPTTRQQPFLPGFLPLSGTHTESKNREVVQQLIGNQYNQSWDAANNLMLWMIENRGQFPPSNKNINLISLTFKPNDYVAKIQNVSHIFFQFPVIVNLSDCYWEYPDTTMSFWNGTVTTSSNAGIWAVGILARGNANGNGAVYLMQGAEGHATHPGKVTNMSLKER